MTSTATEATPRTERAQRRDILMYGMSASVPAALLLHWAQNTPGLHDFPAPDFHRLQIEHWIWSRRATLGTRILDIGVYNRRDYLGAGYVTCGEHDEDRKGSLLALPFADNTFDSVILTEVLEHCTDPVGGVNQARRVLKPGGRLLVTSPFCWPTHGIDGEYKDYWRFARQGWEFLLRAFVDIEITACAWTDEGAAAYDLMRRFECQGFANETEMTTGYLCSGRKPA